MQISVNLQEPFSYSLVPLLIMVLAFLIFSVYLIHLMKKKKGIKIEERKYDVIPEKNKKNISAIKEKYLEQLNTIEHKYINNKIDLRKAYQLISESMRMFVFEVTDIKIQNYSLKEIKKTNIPNLYELIEEYYEPEFASKSVGDFGISIEKARRVIEKWN